MSLSKNIYRVSRAKRSHFFVYFDERILNIHEKIFRYSTCFRISNVDFCVGFSQFLWQNFKSVNYYIYNN